MLEQGLEEFSQTNEQKTSVLICQHLVLILSLSSIEPPSYVNVEKTRPVVKRWWEQTQTNINVYINYIGQASFGYRQ